MHPWTIVAQIVNFLIFVGILHHLLYRPVRQMMEERRSKMEQDRQEAQTARDESEQIRKEAESRERELQQKRDSILQEAREQAAEEKQKTLEETRSVAESRLEQYRRGMRRDREEALRELTRDLGAVVVAATESILKEASLDLNDAAIDRLESRLQDVEKDRLSDAAEELDQNDRQVGVQVAQELSDPQKERLASVLATAFGRDEIKLKTETNEALLAGLRVEAGPLRIEADWREPVESALKKATHELLQASAGETDEMNEE